jgi:hypothetical protein
VFATLIPILYVVRQKFSLRLGGRPPNYLNSSKAVQPNLGN